MISDSSDKGKGAKGLVKTGVKKRFVIKPRQTRREFPFSDEEFQILADLIHQKTGILMREHKKNMVYGRLARRLRHLGMKSFKDYLLYLNGKEGPAELVSLVNAITTNLTRFFREAHHFEHLEEVALRNLVIEAAQGKRERIRIWSAGCSSGEEPYSIAASLDRLLKKFNVQHIDAKILATDLDTNMLQKGRDGVYKFDFQDNLDPKYQKYFEKKDENKCHVSSQLRKYISFKPLNLLAEWPFKGPFDIVFCRNVMIYFDNETKKSLTQRFFEKVAWQGWFYIGHSETLLNPDLGFKLQGRTIYHKPSRRYDDD